MKCREEWVCTLHDPMPCIQWRQDQRVGQASLPMMSSRATLYQELINSLLGDSLRLEQRRLEFDTRVLKLISSIVQVPFLIYAGQSVFFLFGGGIILYNFPDCDILSSEQ